MPPGVSAEASRVLDLLRRFGSEAISFQTLQSGYRYFFHGTEACVAYVDTGRAWVAAGAPVSAREARAEVVAAFLDAAARAGKRVCFFGVEQPLASRPDEALESLGIGEQPVWDPRTWPRSLSRHRSLREQLRRARAKGVSTREVSASELACGMVREQVALVRKRWLAARVMAPMGFLVQLEPFDFSTQRRTFIAEQDGRVIGFAGVIPVPARGGFFLENLVRDPQAPNGTGELLVHAVMLWASRAECSWLTLGLAPLSGAVPPFLERIRGGTRLLYDFAGLRAYKAKFRPDFWQPVYVCYPNNQRRLGTLADVLCAFAPGGWLRFGLRTLLRGPTLVLGALARLLIPWTLLLAWVPSERWFAAGWVKWTWVGFDVLLALGLFRLLHKSHLALLTALAIAVSADAALSGFEAMTWNVRHVQGPLDYWVLAVACAAPSLAALVLWGARHQRLSVA